VRTATAALLSLGIALPAGVAGASRMEEPSRAETCSWQLHLDHMNSAWLLPRLQATLDDPRFVPELKNRVLLLLSQSVVPEAHEILRRTAKGEVYPELQRTAIRCLGTFGEGENGATLSEIYDSTTDRVVKQAVLQALMVSSEHGRLLALAEVEADMALRREAVEHLSAMGPVVAMKLVQEVFEQ
jgi:hypothetical protein